MSRNPARGGCPLCRSASVPEFAPFCSRACKDRDLLTWLGDGYRIPGKPVDDDELQKSSDYGVDSSEQ